MVDEKKSTALAIGIIAGLALVGTALMIYFSKPHEQAGRDINQIVEEAKKTVQKLEEAVEFVRQSGAPAESEA